MKNLRNKGYSFDLKFLILSVLYEKSNKDHPIELNVLDDEILKHELAKCFSETTLSITSISTTANRAYLDTLIEKTKEKGAYTKYYITQNGINELFKTKNMMEVVSNTRLEEAMNTRPINPVPT